MLLRGAITYGKIVHNNQMIFGPALVRAYELESKKAVYPRVIIDRNITDTMKNSSGLSLSRATLNPSLNRKDDGDEYYYSHYLNNCPKEYLDKLLLDANEMIQEYIKGLEEYESNEPDKDIVARENKIIKKWEWFRDYIESAH